MRVTDTFRQLEIGIWRDGVAVTPLYLHAWDFKAGQFHMFQVQSNRGPERYDVRLENREPMVNGWMSGLMWLTDWYGSVLGQSPALIYTEPTDLPMTTAFPCTWAESEMAGLWVVSTRVPRPRDLSELAEAVSG